MADPFAILPAPSDATLFLDFDGTLVEIADDPRGIDVPAGLAGLLNRLEHRLEGRLAIVTGRPVADIRSFLPRFEGAVCGGHGAELSLAAGRSTPLAEMSPSALDDARGQAARLAAANPGILVEDKPTGVAIHYRHAREAEGDVRTLANGIAARYDDVAVQTAHFAYELRPSGASKDRALALLMTRDPFAGMRPVFAGDDDTDEPAIRHVEASGGVGIRIGETESAARLRLPGPTAMLDLLEGWLK